MDQLARLDVTDLDEARLERQDVGVAQGKSLGSAFPLDLPVGSCTPAIAIHEEAEIGVVEEEFAVKTLDVDGPDVLFTRHKVKGSVSLVQERLTFGGFERDNFETFGASYAKSGSKVVDRGRFGWDIEFLTDIRVNSCHKTHG